MGIVVRTTCLTSCCVPPMFLRTILVVVVVVVPGGVVRLTTGAAAGDGCGDGVPALTLNTPCFGTSPRFTIWIFASPATFLALVNPGFLTTPLWVPSLTVFTMTSAALSSSFFNPPTPLTILTGDLLAYVTFTPCLATICAAPFSALIRLIPFTSSSSSPSNSPLSLSNLRLMPLSVS
uniref:(northern house mosquito) hypothetical protein n=1 Tax=Culex pipiens TaxID=7175 RepID=A0A8D8PJQ9_CULPI